MQGKIKNINEEKGYGFIISIDDNQEYFFHRSGLLNYADWSELKKGTLVEFNPSKGDKGPRAADIALVD